MALTLSEKQLMDVLDQTMKGLPEHRYRNFTIVAMSYLLGLQAKELAKTKIGSIYDCEQEEIKESLTIDREIPITDNIKEPLTFYCETRFDEEAPISIAECIDLPLFKSQKGGFFSANTMQKLIKKIYVESGCPDASSHSGRDAYIRNLIAAGDDIETVMKKAGFSSLQTTLRYFD